MRLLALLLCAFGSISTAFALDAAEAQRLLEQADSLKMARPDEFDALLDRVRDESRDLPIAQRDYLRYLRGYRAAYQGDFDVALPLLEALARETGDPTLKFRAAATIANVHVIATHYELAYAQLRPLLDLLPKVTDPAARQQGMAVAAYLYNQVGEYGLALSYADRIIEENWGNGACRGAQLRVEALYRSGTAQPSDPEFQSRADECTKQGEPLIASGIRIHYARLLVVMAYHTLYRVARATGHERAALAYHEKFAAADKGYLDELSARQLPMSA
jgi:hypothetical protein